MRAERSGNFWETYVATHKSAEKRARQTIKRTARNTGLRTRVKSAIKTFREALKASDKSVADTAFVKASRELRKAGTKGVMHSRTVSRRVGRLASALHSKFTASA